jgi:S-formylglutathione hydrolase FrmB
LQAVSLVAVDGLPGAPWDRPLAGTLDRLVVESELLAGNPLGDPTRRPLYVYRPPGVEAGTGRAVPSVYVIQGYSGQVDMWLGRSAFEPTVVERLDAMFAAGDCPDAVLVFVDAWTSLGGSQFLNSSSTGPYLDHLCDEIVPFVDRRYPTRAAAEHRGIAGKSSGGYGAMVVPMLRPDVFGALASHAGDALFECCYLPEFPAVARGLRDGFDGSIETMRRRLAEEPKFDWSRYGAALSLYAYACAYTPDPERPGEALLPFDLRTGRLKPDVWERWLALDPVRMAEPHADALRSMRRIYLDAGKQDQFFLDLGAQAFSDELTRLGIDHTLELFEGTHDGISYRYPGAVRELVLALGGQ